LTSSRMMPTGAAPYFRSGLLYFRKKDIDLWLIPWYKIENGFQYQIMKKKPTEQLTEYLAGQGLKSTSQRDQILRIFLDAGRHVSAEELYALVKKVQPGIGYATVYRTLKLLADAGLAEERRFEDGFTRYEYKASAGDHHDHLICNRCGEIVEFENGRIEALQQDVARKNGFQVQSHKLEIYGLCRNCQGKRRKLSLA
jgi:Fur family ferric uptake transcriptional regulator